MSIYPICNAHTSQQEIKPRSLQTIAEIALSRNPVFWQNQTKDKRDYVLAQMICTEALSYMRRHLTDDKLKLQIMFHELEISDIDSGFKKDIRQCLLECTSIDKLQSKLDKTLSWQMKDVMYELIYDEAFIEWKAVIKLLINWRIQPILPDLGYDENLTTWTLLWCQQVIEADACDDYRHDTNVITCHKELIGLRHEDLSLVLFNYHPSYSNAIKDDFYGHAYNGIFVRGRASFLSLSLFEWPNIEIYKLYRSLGFEPGGNELSYLCWVYQCHPEASQIDPKGVATILCKTGCLKALCENDNEWYGPACGALWENFCQYFPEPFLKVVIDYFPEQYAECLTRGYHSFLESSAIHSSFEIFESVLALYQRCHVLSHEEIAKAKKLTDDCAKLEALDS
ncbi:MAG: hypothetical protein H7A39_00020 [Chlamydiales bacterium]|nr:hypothetical protein [Chlamydiales bacterium]